MSERFNVDTSDVLGANYLVTSITPSNYNPAINGTLTVTVTVKDVYGDAVSGEEVTVSASGGAFTALNGSSITGASSVTGTTNASGQFTLTYTCSVFGLITFTANNTQVQVKVGGWKTYYNSSPWRVEYNETTTRVTLASTTTVTSTTTEAEYAAIVLSASYLRPKQVMMFPTYNGNVMVFARPGSSKLSHRTISGSVTMSSQYFQVEWTHQGLS